MLHANDDPPPPPALTREADWSCVQDEDENHGLNALVEEIHREAGHSFLLDDGGGHISDIGDIGDIGDMGDMGAHVGSKRSRTARNAPAKVQRTSEGVVASCSINRDAEPAFGTSTLNFVVLYVQYERQFLERTKAALGIEHLPYSIREEHATNAFLAARFAMATETVGTARASNAVKSADMTADEKQQATEDALTQEEHDLAEMEERKYFDSMLPGRLALATALAFS